MTVLEAKNVTKIYGGSRGSNSTYALNGVDIKVTTGEFVGVMGPSGSGKTTLLQMLSGIDRPTSGNILLEGKDISMMNPEELALFRRQRMGFVFQEFNLLDSLTLKENIILPMILDHKKAGEMEAKSNTLMKQFGIDGIADKYPYQVSGGQQQRAAVTRAVIQDPAIVFADEPTGNLDSKSSQAVMSCLEQMNAEQGVTVLMVTHDPFAASHCKRIVFIKDGDICLEIVRNEDRKLFFDRILDCLAALGG